MSGLEPATNGRNASPRPASHAPNIHDAEADWVDDDDDMEFEPTTDESDEMEFFDPADEGMDSDLQGVSQSLASGTT